MLTVEPQLRSTFVDSGRLSLVFSPVLDYGDRSQKAAEGAYCAGAQGQFWPMHDLLFERQSELWQANYVEAIKSMAATLNLDVTRFDQCLDSGETADAVKAADAARRSEGIRVRPSFKINGRLVPGAQSFATFEQLLSE